MFPPQIGTVVDGGETGAISKKQQRTTMLADLMQDEKIKKRAKSQYAKVQAAAMEGTRRHGSKKTIQKAVKASMKGKKH